jgi:hypothetical protein
MTIKRKNGHLRIFRRWNELHLKDGVVQVANDHKIIRTHDRKLHTPVSRNSTLPNDWNVTKEKKCLNHVEGGSKQAR